MRINKSAILALSMLPFILLHASAYAYDEGTHAQLNEEIVRNNIAGYSLNSYLINMLDFEAGVKEIFEKDGDALRVWEWFREGGMKEDKPGSELSQYLAYYLNSARNNNHFHN